MGLCCGFGATVASVQAERSVREKARWLEVGWERAGRERKRGGSGLAGNEQGEREREVARGAGGGSVALDSEEKRAQ